MKEAGALLYMQEQVSKNQSQTSNQVSTRHVVPKLLLFGQELFLCAIARV